MMVWSPEHFALTGKALVALGLVLLFTVALWSEYANLRPLPPAFPTGFQPPT